MLSNGERGMAVVIALVGVALVKYLNLVPILLTVGAMLFASQ